jgi:ankyrin repeat protein
LSYAVSRRNIDLIELLLEHGAGLDNTEANGKTALHLAMESTSNLGPSAFGSHYQQSDESIVELLLRRGATVNVTDDTGETALYKACKKNNIQLATAVLQRGADPNLKTTDKYPLILPLARMITSRW